jgi:hypothetical protein
MCQAGGIFWVQAMIIFLRKRSKTYAVEISAPEILGAKILCLLKSCVIFLVFFSTS